jgi:hypothetical protein
MRPRRNIVGCSTSFLDAMPRDPAQNVGPLQQKIITMLGDESVLTEDEKNKLVRIYCYYQQRNKLYRSQAGEIMRIWNSKFAEKEARKQMELVNT